MARPKIFIDGEAGTTGLQIVDRLTRLGTVEIVSIDPAQRKDVRARSQVMATVDLAILCLPDDAAREAVALAEELGDRAPRIIDASSAYRVAPGWTYGFAELTAPQADAIAASRRVTNPGCYPTGAIALLRPLIDRGLIPQDTPMTINAVSGYSGGGKAMIAAYDAHTAPAFELYGLDFAHKHTPEITHYAGLSRTPIFIPSVGNFAQGMLVSIPIHLDTLPNKPTAQAFQAALKAHYEGSAVEVVAATQKRIAAETLASSDRLQLTVYADALSSRALLVARLDNLGKGAAGAAIQNMNLMLGLN